ncbi:MAG: hypothetical protein ACLP7Q_13585 [Isosphaeraceae bacterium]
MAVLEEQLLKIFNSSGFPLQVSLQREIERTINDHGWKVDVGEHRWNHRELRESGYIDLVISHRDYSFTVLIECKRMREGNWIFLTPEGSSPDCSRASAFHTSQGSHQAEDAVTRLAHDVFWWADAAFAPVSIESQFCIMKGQEEKNPMLEKIADGLLPAIEAVGLEYLALNSRVEGKRDSRLFLPVIVTNANLRTATYDPMNINLASGELDKDKCAFATVPFIRFRKSLSTHYPSLLTRSIGRRQGRATLEEASKGNERTILVINSLAISDTLRQLRIPRGSSASFESGFSSADREMRKG